MAHKQPGASIFCAMGADLWVFLPTYNEAENLDAIVRATADQLERTEPGNWRVLIVDDSSPDGTGDLADGLAAELEGIEVLHRPARTGWARPTWPASSAPCRRAPSW